MGERSYTGVGEGFGVRPHHPKRLLSHVSGAKAGVAGIYNRAKYLPQMKRALAIWADHVASITSGEERIGSSPGGRSWPFRARISPFQPSEGGGEGRWTKDGGSGTSPVASRSSSGSVSVPGGARSCCQSSCSRSAAGPGPAGIPRPTRPAGEVKQSLAASRSASDALAVSETLRGFHGSGRSRSLVRESAGRRRRDGWASL